jgi:hypothetical protein
MTRQGMLGYSGLKLNIPLISSLDTLIDKEYNA